MRHRFNRQALTLFIVIVGMLPTVVSSENKVIKKFPVKASQGVAVGQHHFYAISNTKITKHKKQTGKLVTSWQADKKDARQKHFKHLNSGTVIGQKLYCAHSRFPKDPNDNTIEIWNIKGELLQHEQTIRLPRKHGSFTWIDQHPDGSWWMCYAVYGKDKNKETKLVRYARKDNKFIEKHRWNFPDEVIAQWGHYSCSGGSWGSDGLLYTTGHDDSKTFVLQLTQQNQFKHVKTEAGLGFFGQAIAWDRFSDQPVLWGIVRNKNISLTSLPPGNKKLGK